MNKNNKPARRNSQPARKRKSRPIVNTINAARRFAGRIHWSSIALRLSAIAALVVVEIAVAVVIGHLAGDPISQAILVSTAALGGLGVVLGPGIALSLRKGPQRNIAIAVVFVCLAMSAWNLSTTLANSQAMSVAASVQADPDYPAQRARLASLNRRIDAMADERNDGAVAIYTSERDQLQERIDKANPEPIMFAWTNDGILYWIKAFVFHGLIAGFSAAFAIPMRPKRAPAKAKKSRPRSVSTDGNVVAFQNF